MQPESEIIVKISKEDAGAISLARVVQQRVALRDLVRLIVAVTGKDAPRLAAVLERGSFVKGMSRLRWKGFAGESALARCLAELPDPMPGRPFQLDQVSELELTGVRGVLTIAGTAARQHRWFHRSCFLDRLGGICADNPPAYARYDYEAKADLFAGDLSPGAAEAIRQASDLLPGNALRAASKQLTARRILFRLPRQ